MASTRPALAPEERAALTSEADLQRFTGGGPLRLTDRSISQLELTNVVLDRLELRDVDLETVRLRDTRFLQARLENVSFTACELLGTTFEASTLSACRFTDCYVQKSRLVGSTGLEWQTATCRFDELALERTTIEGWADRHGMFEDARLVGTQVIGTDWKRTQLTRPRLEATTFAGGKMDSVVLENGGGTGIVLRELNVDGLEVLLGDYAGLTFEAVTGRGLRLTDVNCRGLGLVGCSELAGVSASGLTCAGLVIDGCQPLAMLTIGHSRIEALSMSGTQVMGAVFRDCRIVDDGVIARSQLDGFDFGGSTLQGLTVRETAISTLLRMVGAEVRGLRIENVRYDQGLEIDASGANFTDGDSFPLTGS